MWNCLSELNLIYCLIYLHDIIVFLQTSEEHLHRLHVVFNWFREYNLKLKPSKCSLFKEEINYLVHWVSKGGVWPSNSNLRAIAECAPPQTYTEIQAFLSLVGHYQWFIKGFTCITQPLNQLLSGEGASRKLEWVSLPKDALGAFDALKQACMSAPVLSFTDYTKEFLLETDASKEELGAVLSQKQADRQYDPVTYCCVIFLLINCYTGASTTNAIAEVWVIIPTPVGYFIRKYIHFLWALHQILDLSNPHEYAQVLLSIVHYNFLLKLYI